MTEHRFIQSATVIASVVFGAAQIKAGLDWANTAVAAFMGAFIGNSIAKGVVVIADLIRH